MRPIASLATPIIYLLFFHAATKACFVLFGPFALDPNAAIHLRGIGYIAISALAAAAIVLGVYLRCFGRIPLKGAVKAGVIAIAILLTKDWLLHGLGAFKAMLLLKPAHVAISYAVIFSSLPVLAVLFNRAANTSLDSDASRRST